MTSLHSVLGTPTNFLGLTGISDKPPVLFRAEDLGIRAPANFASDKGKGSGVVYANPARGKPQPQPNVLILINNPNDSITTSGAKITAPHRTMVIVAHGNPEDGVQKAIGGKNFYEPAEIAALIKKEAGTNWKHYDKVVFFSCRIALKDGGQYAQNIANALGKPVYAATEFGFVSPTTGNVSVAGSVTPTGVRQRDTGDLGRFIRFEVNGDPTKNASLKLAIVEHLLRSENRSGSGQGADFEFLNGNTNRKCVNTTLSQCIK